MVKIKFKNYLVFLKDYNYMSNEKFVETRNFMMKLRVWLYTRTFSNVSLYKVVQIWPGLICM